LALRMLPATFGDFVGTFHGSEPPHGWGLAGGRVCTSGNARPKLPKAHPLHVDAGDARP
jgi:hypothetical protein